MKTVAIYGFAKTSRALVHQSSAAELWTLNDAYNRDVPMERVTRWYEMHQPEQFSAEHKEWLQQAHPFEIYTLINYPKAIIEKYQYFTNSIAYMLAHAIYDGYQRIELYGVEMSNGTEYAHQKACTEYYLGLARGAGIEIYLPPHCPLLSAPLYGYDTDAQYIKAATVETHRVYYTAQRDEISPENVLYHFFDGAQAQLALLLNRFTLNGYASRHNIDTEARKVVRMFQEVMRDYNFNCGKLSVRHDEATATANHKLLISLYMIDGAVQAIKNLLAHLDLHPYNLEIEPSLKIE